MESQKQQSWQELASVTRSVPTVIGIKEGLQAAGKFAGVGGGAAVAKAVTRKLAPVQAAVNVAEAAVLVGSPAARADAKSGVSSMAKSDPWWKRMAKSAGNPVNTIYGAGANAVDAVKSTMDAGASDRAYASAKQGFDARHSDHQPTVAAR